jgi:hypothetical protein
LLQAIHELKSSAVAEPRFVSLDDEEIVSRLEAALQLEDYDPSQELGLDKNAFCQLVAIRSNVQNNTGWVPMHLGWAYGAAALWATVLRHLGALQGQNGVWALPP